jgi:hypothetical protein
VKPVDENTQQTTTPEGLNIGIEKDIRHL